MRAVRHKIEKDRRLSAGRFFFLSALFFSCGVLSGCEGALLGRLVLPEEQPTYEGHRISAGYAVELLPAPFGYWTASLSSVSQVDDRSLSSESLQTTSRGLEGGWRWSVQQGEAKSGNGPSTPCSMDVLDPGMPPASDWACAFMRVRYLTETLFPQQTLPADVRITVLPPGQRVRRAVLRYSFGAVPFHFYFAAPERTQNDVDAGLLLTTGVMAVVAHEYFHVLVARGLAPSQPSNEREEAAAYAFETCAANLVIGCGGSVIPDALQPPGHKADAQEPAAGRLANAVTDSMRGAASAVDLLRKSSTGKLIDNKTAEGRRKVLDYCSELTQSSWRPTIIENEHAP